MEKPKLFVTPAADCEFRRKFWAENKWDIDWIPGEMNQVLSEKKAQGILISPLETKVWVEKAKNSPIDVTRYGFADSLWLQENRYWPRVIYRDLLRDFTVRVAKTLDIGAWAYIVGSNAWTQMFIFLVSDIGYRKICLVDEDELAPRALIKVVSKQCFGVELRTIKPPDLTQEPNNGSLLVNTLDLDLHSTLFQTLLYLNFIHRPGLIMDLHFNGKISGLLGEATQSGFEVISGVDLRALYDCAILEKLKVPNQIPWPNYLASWRAFLGLMR